MSVTTLEEVFLRVGHGSDQVRAILLLVLALTPQLLVLPYETCCSLEGAYGELWAWYMGSGFMCNGCCGKSTSR